METTVQPPDTLRPGDKEAIVLWNPTAAALWSLLQPEQARQARYWFAGLLLIALGSYVAGAAGALLGRDDLNTPWWLSLVLFGAWCALSAYPQIKHVDEHHGESYARRSWAAPLLVGLAAICAIPFAAGVVAGYRACPTPSALPSWLSGTSVPATPRFATSPTSMVPATRGGPGSGHCWPARRRSPGWSC